MKWEFFFLTIFAAGRIEKGTMPENPVAVKSIVSTPLADAVAEHYGVELRNVLTGFKWIGDQIAQLEAAVKWTVLSSDLKRATDTLQDLMYVIKMPLSDLC